jgi:hypothetical protein
MEAFAHELRDLSQTLDYLRVTCSGLHPAFFLSFSDNADAAGSGSHCAWPKLQHLDLEIFCGPTT